MCVSFLSWTGLERGDESPLTVLNKNESRLRNMTTSDKEVNQGYRSMYKARSNKW